MRPVRRPALLFDLDDTLYDERTYVLSGFRAVADHIRLEHPELDAPALVEAMTLTLDTQGRGAIFDRLAADLGLDQAGERVAAWVGVYRNHRPHITLHPGADSLLDRLKPAFDLAVVTDGLEMMQRRKVAALDIARWTPAIVYCWGLGAPKPRPDGYLEALRLLGRTLEDSIVIGDNPAHDMVAANAIGARSVRVRRGRHAAAPDGPAAPPTLTIEDLSSLEAALDYLCESDSRGART